MADGERLPGLDDEAIHQPALRSSFWVAFFRVGIVCSGVF